MPQFFTFRPPQFLLAPILFLVLIAALGGCGGDNRPESSAAIRVEAPLVACPGAELATLAAVIYVAPAGTDSDSCGDKPATPCASIGAGIARCSVTGCAVAVQHGLYPTTATIVLRDAVSVHGSCRFGDEPEHFYRTVIQAAPPPGEPAITASGINSATALTGVVVIAKDETVPGEASIAMRVAASRGLTLASVTLAAGRGGDGAAGASTAGGAGGNGGSPATFSDVGFGGGACPSAPPASGGHGGAGRDANRFSFQPAACFLDCNCTASASGLSPDQLAGQSSGSAMGGAAGGNGAFGGNCAGHLSQNPTPLDGGSGQTGEMGDCTAMGGTRATGTSSFGKFVAGRWVPSQGGAGSAGGAGGGGGGGGAGGYSTYIAANGLVEAYFGFPGGGGGGGGCGGNGGAGGQQGGASIPLVLVDASVANLVSGASLIPGPGGNGGAGGAGGAGGPGGVAGSAFNGGKVVRSYVLYPNVQMPGAGDSGGNGGNGGPGAGGAGGHGGPSVGIALVGNSPDPAPDGVYAGTPGGAGKQGAGNGNSLCRSADGQAGLQGASASANRYVEGT